MKVQKWYKSPVLWGAIVSLIGVVVVNVFNLIDSEAWKTVITSLLSILSVFGIVNSPSISDGLSATESEEEVIDDGNDI